MPVETWLTFTIGFMILGSIVALELRDILSSIIAIGVVGLGVSMSFLFLQAPDLAIVQFLFEIFALIILVRAFIGKDYHAFEPAKASIALTLSSIIALSAILLLSVPVLRLLPPFGEPLMHTAQHYLDHGARETGAANLVASVILDYRAYDTLGEITVLFTAILGVFTVLRTAIKSEGGTDEE
ncbi:MAG: hydrogen gas-evolving membrane-bound hydrogenase subunit E [candidate division KSB1 bacterium]|nr:hydrogen gas-evolving membrane-bound hydrogenase subunit E [candidate division KSB1 bacterium]